MRLGECGVELDGAERGGTGVGVGGLAGFDGEGGEQSVGVGEAGVGGSVVGVDGDVLAEAVNAVVEAVSRCGGSRSSDRVGRAGTRRLSTEVWGAVAAMFLTPPSTNLAISALRLWSRVCWRRGMFWVRSV